jgi:mutator protein MutT
LQKVTAAIIEKEGKILIARRRGTGMQPGLWEFPGGKVEPGETPEECLQRELLEEFAIRAEVGRFLASSRYRYRARPHELLAYEVRHISGQFQLREHSEILWVERFNLSQYPLSEPDRAIALELRQGPAGSDKK